eukprot:226001_1
MSNIAYQTHCILTITGLPSSLCKTEMLASEQWFGQFGPIHKVCITKSSQDPAIAYIKYTDPISAAKAIQTMNLYQVSDTNHILQVNYNFNPISTLFMNHDESTITRHAEATFKDDEKQPQKTDHPDKLKQLQTENARLKRKNNILERESNNIEMSNKALEHRCLWLQRQLQASVQSTLELQQLLFQDSSPPIAMANIACPEQVEGVIEGGGFI